MVPYSIHRERLEPSISRALLKQFRTGVECFQMGPSLFSSLEFNLSWIRLARARAMPAQESNLKEQKWSTVWNTIHSRESPSNTATCTRLKVFAMCQCPYLWCHQPYFFIISYMPHILCKYLFLIHNFCFFISTLYWVCAVHLVLALRDMAVSAA